MLAHTREPDDASTAKLRPPQLGTFSQVQGPIFQLLEILFTR
jgi:hypothetical protein